MGWPIVVRGSTSSGTTTGTASSVALTLPGGCQPGDTAYCVLNINAGAVITGALSGWTQLGTALVNSFSSSQLWLWTKVLTAADIATGTVTPTCVGGARQLSAGLIVLGAAAHESVSAGQTAQNGVTTGVFDGATPSKDSAMVLDFVTGAATVANSARSFTAATGTGYTLQTQRFDTHATNSRAGVGIYSNDLVGNGGSSAPSGSWNASAAVRAQTVRVIVAPAPVAYFAPFM